MKKARITVCIPAYNRPDFLCEALTSLCDQGLDRDEYVVAISDNASDPPLERAIKPFHNALQIEYRRNPANIGHLDNFACALDLAETPFLSFLPDDDIIAPGQLKRALQVLEGRPGCVLVAALIICQKHPGAFGTVPRGFFPSGGRRAAYCENYVWDKAEWMALALVDTPLSVIGSVFREDTFRKCKTWKSYPLWHDRLMLAEMGLHGDVISLPWIAGYNRLTTSQLNTSLAKTHGGEFVETSKVVLRFCELNQIPVLEFWTNLICATQPTERPHYLRMLARALPADRFKDLKRRCEEKLGARLHSGGRLARLGIPWTLAELIRSKVLGHP